MENRLKSSFNWQEKRPGKENQNKVCTGKTFIIINNSQDESRVVFCNKYMQEG